MPARTVFFPAAFRRAKISGNARCVSGFTLFELLVVISILVAISFLAYGAYAGVQQQTNEQLAEVRLARLAQAMNRFRADMGYYPGDEQLRLGADCTSGVLERPDLAPASVTNLAAWDESRANLWMLFEKPRFCDNKPLTYLNEPWNPATGRGWNGPYLPLETIEWVELSSGGEVPAWSAGSPHIAGDGVLSWHRIPEGRRLPSDEPLGAHGRPLTFHPAAIPPDSRYPPRLIYWGADGRCGENGFDDCDPPQTAICSPTSAATADEKAACDNIVINLRP